MRIESLHLKGVGPFDDATFEFTPGTNPKLADVYLLVGQNGCGKTTALHAIAGMVGGPTVGGALGLRKRFRSQTGEVELRADTQRLVAAIPRSSQTLPEKLKGMRADLNSVDGLVFWQATDRGLDVNLLDLQKALAGGGARQLAWAPFGYSGQRNLSHHELLAVSDDATPPLKGALAFDSIDDGEQLARWIANQNYKRLKAKEARLTERARAAAASIERIEEAVSTLVGTSFRFHFSVDDQNVRAALNDDIVDFSLLPNGLKSIVSWLADLLMRLDRLRWQDDTPIEQRRFLLLLDEVDVHLHPSWQRKLLPTIQGLFPNAQIIATTHSPFVVASLADGAVIECVLDERGRSTARPPLRAPLSLSYSATMRSLFGIESDFDLETETLFKAFQKARERLLSGELQAEAEVQRLADTLRTRGEEIGQLVQFALHQLKRAQALKTGT